MLPLSDRGEAMLPSLSDHGGGHALSLRSQDDTLPPSHQLQGGHACFLPLFPQPQDRGTTCFVRPREAMLRPTAGTTCFVRPRDDMLRSTTSGHVPFPNYKTAGRHAPSDHGDDTPFDTLLSPTAPVPALSDHDRSCSLQPQALVPSDRRRPRSVPSTAGRTVHAPLLRSTLAMRVLPSNSPCVLRCNSPCVLRCNLPCVLRCNLRVLPYRRDTVHTVACSSGLPVAYSSLP